jgi:NADH-quinone oxidoreductase subunit M
MSAFVFVLSVVGPVALGAAAALAGRAPDVSRARLFAWPALGLAAIAAVAWGALGASSGAVEPWAAPLPAFVVVVGAVAVAASFARDSGAGTVGRVLAATALSAAFVVTRAPLALAALWAASMLPPWFELRARAPSRGTARAFAFYMLPSALLVGVGALALEAGQLAVAVPCLILGFAIREAIAPLHAWAPALFERAPLAIVIPFVAPQLGVYAHLRLLGGAVGEWGPSIAAAGAVTAVFAAALGAAQDSPRRALAWLFMSESGLVAFGLETHADVARAGAWASWLTLGVAFAGFVAAAAAVEARRGPRLLSRSAGSFSRTPRLAAAFGVLGLACVGLPGTFGYVAEDLLVQGAVEDFPILALVLVVATALNATTVMRMFFAFFGGARAPAGEADLTRRESFALGLSLLIVIGAGVLPALALRPMMPTHGAAAALPAARVVSVAPER